MVRLKVFEDKRFPLQIARFNSEMVRLKAIMEIENLIDVSRFNSEMVRLKGLGKFLLYYYPEVSIPKWFD